MQQDKSSISVTPLHQRLITSGITQTACFGVHSQKRSEQQNKYQHSHAFIFLLS
jgi:hypothetical protein